jgi:hypothetical protein
LVSDGVVSFPGTRHEIVDVQVVIECACGDLLHGDTEQHAIADFQLHVDEQEVD